MSVKLTLVPEQVNELRFALDGRVAALEGQRKKMLALGIPVGEIDATLYLLRGDDGEGGMVQMLAEQLGLFNLTEDIGADA